MSKKNVYWNELEIMNLKKLYNLGASNKEICKILKRPKNSVSKKASRLGLRSNKLWSKEEEEILKVYYLKMNAEELGKKINRSSWAVNTHLMKMGLKKDKETLGMLMRSRPDSIFSRGKNHYRWTGGQKVTRYANRKWKAIRRDILKRDNYICQKCNNNFLKNQSSLHVHHIIPIRITENDNNDNLISLCKSCHRYVHQEIERIERILNYSRKLNHQRGVR